MAVAVVVDRSANSFFKESLNVNNGIIGNAAATPG